MAVHSFLERSMAAVADTFDGPIEVDELLHLICLAAVDTVGGADFAGILLADRHGKIQTPAATHRIVLEADLLQFDLKEGPCLDAVRGRWQTRSDDLRTDARWPKYGPWAAELGILSQWASNSSTSRA